MLRGYRWSVPEVFLKCSRRVNRADRVSQWPRSPLGRGKREVGPGSKALKYISLDQVDGPMANIWPTNGRRNGQNGLFLAVGSGDDGSDWLVIAVQSNSIIIISKIMEL